MPGPPSPDFANWRAHLKSVDGIAAYGGGANALTLTGEGEPERIEGTMVTSATARSARDNARGRP